MIYIKQQIEEFTYSNITQDYPDYDPDTIYTVEDIYDSPTSASICRYGGYYWRSVVDNNVGNNPESNENIKWIRWEVDNKYAMLDTKSLSKTSEDTDVNGIIVEFDRNYIDALAIGYLETSGVTIEHLDTDGNVIDEVTKVIEYSVNEEVFDLWDYMYAEYSTAVDRAVYVPIAPLGVKLRVTISINNETNKASCGFLIGGESVDMGDTLDDVNFSYNSFSYSETDDFGNLDIIKRNVQDLVDFNTLIDSTFVSRARRNIKSSYDEIVAFVVDESEDSVNENMITLGKISNASTTGTVYDKTVISWSVQESI